jgi:hypothetical protein
MIARKLLFTVSAHEGLKDRSETGRKKFGFRAGGGEEQGCEEGGGGFHGGSWIEDGGW